MSQQSTPGAQPAAGFSRIPTLSSNRSGANSRLPSPPVSPGLSSPSTPPGASLYVSGSGTWTAGMLAHARERLTSTGSASSLAGIPPATTPHGVGNRSHPSPSLPRADPLRTSVSGLGRPPLTTSMTTSASPVMGAGVHDAAVSPSATVRPSSAGGVPGGAVAAYSGWDAASGGAGSRSNIQVAVRVRPLCDKERQRGDRVAWGADRDGNVGLLDAGTETFTPKHRFDTIFGPDSDNSTVAATVALPLVAPALIGVNGTIFAYGVTSSGKTHTMMGTERDPGVVPRVVRELFSQIAAAAGQSCAAAASLRCYSVRMSIMEIYNEVLNDLLDPSRTNLKVREDSRSGLVLVEGLMEQTVVTAEQALEFISRGDHNRKVSATAFNEDSSRSHTITRIIVESTPYLVSTNQDPSASAGDRPVGRRTTACLSLIDLAGSESARAVVSKGQRMEGSYINRSLLTLGTVIHKLAAGATGHVPFRDSKLTRLLQPSLSGPGARVAVVCNITPAAAQTDETANTLKFAARAKLVQVTARTNEILDERTLLRRYMKEVADLKRQLAEARRLLVAAGVNPGGVVSAPASRTAASAAGGVAGGGGDGDGFEALGVLVSAEEAAAAELESERDARRVVEMESMMMRIKLARMQAFLEERGVNVDDLFLAASTTSLDLAGLGGGQQPRGPFPGEDAAPAVNPAASPTGGNTNASTTPSSRRLYDTATAHPSGDVRGMRHASSTPRLAGEGGGDHDGGGAAAAAARARGSYSGCSVEGPELEEGVVGPGPWPVWSEEPAVERTGRQLAAAAAAFSPSAASGAAAPTRAATTAELRAQVAAALSAAAAGNGGGAAGRGGSASATTSISEVEMDDEDNEGLMAQIRDMISEARLSSPTPQSATSQPGPLPCDGSIAGEAAGDIVPGAGSRRAPSAYASGHPASLHASGRRPSGGSFAAGGPASTSSLHRRSTTLSTASSSYGAGAEDMDLELQVLNADREVLHDQLVASEAANERLTAQLTDLRRQLSMYEQLTRQAAGELAEIRRLKEAFQARLQRENDALRGQLAQLGVATSGPPATPTGLQQQQEQQQQQQQRSREHQGAMGPPPPRTQMGAGVGLGGSLSEAGVAGTAAATHHVPHSPSQPHPHRQQQPHQRHGVHSMAAFGSPAYVAPMSASRGTSAPGGPATKAGGSGAPWPAGETPTRATPSASNIATNSAVVAAARQRPSGIPVSAAQQPQPQPHAAGPEAAASGPAAVGNASSYQDVDGIVNCSRTDSLHAMPSFGASFGVAAASRPAADLQPRLEPDRKSVSAVAPSEEVVLSVQRQQVVGEQVVGAVDASTPGTPSSRLQQMEATVMSLMKDRDRVSQVEAERQQLLALLRLHGIQMPGALQQR